MKEERGAALGAAGTAAAAALVWLSTTAGMLAASTFVALPPEGRLVAPLVASTVLSGAYWFLLRGKAALPAMLALPLLFGGAVVGASGTAWRRRLEAYKGELRAQGLPVSVADLERSAPTGPAADPAAVAALSKHETGIAKKLHPGQKPGPWTEAVYGEESGFVQAAEGPLLEKISAVLKGRPSRYGAVDWAEAARRPLSVSTPRFGNLIGAGNALGLSACWRAYRGETALAWDRIRTMLDLADLVATEPSVIGKAIAQAIRRRAATDATTVLFAAKTGLMPPDVAGRLSAFSAPGWMADGIQGELARNLDAVAFLSALRWKEFRGSSGFDGLFSGGCLAGDDSSCGPTDLSPAKPVGYAAFRLFGLAGLWDLNGLEQARALSAFAAPMTSDKLPARVARLTGVTAAWTPWPHAPALMATPSYKRLQTSAFEGVGWDRLALTVSALKGFRAARGAYPKALEELAPAFAAPEAIQDPVTGKAFRYAPGEKGYELCADYVDPDSKGPACLKP